MPKPDITRLLVDSALRPELLRRLVEAPESVFEEYDLSEEEQDLLRTPDHRLLPLLGAVLQRSSSRSASPQASSLAPEVQVPTPDPASPEAKMLPDTRLALTVLPCQIGERIAFAAWISPLGEGADPSRIPPPAGSNLPGVPLNPLHAVAQITAAQVNDGSGKPRINMWASLRQSTNIISAPPPETMGDPQSSPFASKMDSPAVRAAAREARDAAPANRYVKIAALLRTLRGGDVR